MRKFACVCHVSRSVDNKKIQNRRFYHSRDSNRYSYLLLLSRNKYIFRIIVDLKRGLWGTNDVTKWFMLDGGKFYQVLHVKKGHKAVVDVLEVSPKDVYVDDRRPCMVVANLRTRCQWRLLASQITSMLCATPHDDWKCLFWRKKT